MRLLDVVRVSLAGIAIGAVGLQVLHAQAKPKAYVVIETDVIDEAAFKEFLPKVAEANKAAGGSFLARGGRTAAMDGPAPKRVTIQVFESFDQRTTEMAPLGRPSSSCRRRPRKPVLSWSKDFSASSSFGVKGRGRFR